MEPGDLVGAILDGRYRVIEPIAEGAMGVVYRAERVKLGRIVAVKVLHDVLPNELSSRKRFEIEAMAMAKLEHPHCASVLDVGVHNNKPYVVMDFVSGQNLKEVISTGPIPVMRAADIVRQVLSGLAHAHEHGIIHRDIKPANIVLSQKTGLGDHVKILDFGLARLHDGSQNLTLGIVVGTPAYMAPEQIRGQQLDSRADVYACGVLLFELLTGKKPYHSPKDDPIEVCKMHLSNPIPRLSDVLPGVDFGEFEAIVTKALAKSADERFASAQEFAAAIEAAVARRPSLQAMPPRPPSGPIPVGARDRSAVQVESVDVMSSMPDSRAMTEQGVPRTAAPADVSAPFRGGQRSATPAAGTTRLPTPVAGSPRLPTPVAGSPRLPTPVAGSPQLGTPAAGSPRLPTPFGGTPRAKTASPRVATPATGVPTTELGEQVSAPGTFLGLAVAARPATQSASAPAAPQDSSQSSVVAAVPRRIRRGTLAIVGFGILTVAVVISIVASRGHVTDKQARDGGAHNGSEIQMDPALEIVDRATSLAASGERDAAIDLLAKARRQYPDSGALPYALGRIYFSKFYWSEGLKHFRDAIRLDPSYRSDPELIKTVLRGFITTPGYNDELASFLRNDIGAAAEPYLEETARDHPNASIRARAANELRRYH